MILESGWHKGRNWWKKLERSSPQGCISFQTDEKFDSNAAVILIKNESIFVHDQNNDLDHYRDKRLNDWKLKRYVEIWYMGNTGEWDISIYQTVCIYIKSV